MINFHRIVGLFYRKIEAWMRPWLYRKQKKAVVARFPHLAPVMAAFERHYIRVEYGAHDRSLMERIQRKVTDEDRFIYGSTPWTAFMKVLDTLELGKEESFVELGCGTGHLCFLVHQAYGVRSTGLESLANFIDTSKIICKELKGEGLNLEGLTFYNLDFFNFDCTHATLFYLASTCFPEDYRNQLLDKLEKEMQAGARLIVLTHAVERSAFRLLHRVEAVFSWGRDKAYIYEKL